MWPHHMVYRRRGGIGFRLVRRLESTTPTVGLTVGLMAIVIVIVCFSHTNHSAGNPGAGGSSDQKGDTRLARASNRKNPQVALELGVALRVQGHERSVHQDGIRRVHAGRVTYKGTLDTRDAVRRPDGVSAREH